MSKFIVKANVLNRMSKIPVFFEPTTSEDLKKQIRTIRLEIKSGKMFAVATNQQVAAVEYLGETKEPDDVCYLRLECEFLNETEGLITVETIPEIALSTALHGAKLVNDCCLWFDNNIMDNWRSWIGKQSGKHKGFMFWELYHIQTLFEASPSGKIVFPEDIDASEPVVLRDSENENWVGLFVPDQRPGEIKCEPAKLPDWWK